MPRAGWLAILKRSVREFKHDDVTDRAAALTYYGVLALFPAVLVLVSILGLLGKSTTQQVLDNLGQVAQAGAHLPEGCRHPGAGQGRHGQHRSDHRPGNRRVVRLGLCRGLHARFERHLRRRRRPPDLEDRSVRLVTTVALVVMLVIAAAIVVLTGPIANQVGTAFGIGSTAVLIRDIVKWPVLLIIVSMMISLLYKASPNVRQPAFRWISAGGVVAVVIWLIASGLFAVYVSFSGSYNKTYGALATVIIFLVWLWISNIAILLGAEFNAEAQRERAIRAGLPEDAEPFAELRDTANSMTGRNAGSNKSSAPGTGPWIQAADIPTGRGSGAVLPLAGRIQRSPARTVRVTHCRAARKLGIAELQPVTSGVRVRLSCSDDAYRVDRRGADGVADVREPGPGRL